mmetsp:Transcript_8666/g.27496  ORF Transcript_8666/g.27496 Transcript_8666/m.27496 type:complete len:453 (-) Transcript_8666:489-1847(-)
MAEIHVCHAGTCRARGAEAVLAEIEELVSEVGGRCKVRQSGCLGYCSEAPNAIILERGARRLDPNTRVFTRIRTLDASAKVVERATGMRPPLEGAGTSERLASLRATRARQHAISVSKWNTALHGLAEQTAVKPALRSELSTLLRKAGFPEGVCANRSGQAMPSAIANYSQWSLESVTPVSRHSALFAFTSSDLKRGTPHPRGRGRMAEPVTWHTTLLAEVGSNAEGPLPWVERDYTPVSSAKEWEQGRCEMLIKVYADGAATAWLHSASPQRVWLSLPQRTLRVPGLVSEGRAFRPSSVLLLLPRSCIRLLVFRLALGGHGLSCTRPHLAVLTVHAPLVFTRCSEDSARDRPPRPSCRRIQHAGCCSRARARLRCRRSSRTAPRRRSLGSRRHGATSCTCPSTWSSRAARTTRSCCRSSQAGAARARRAARATSVSPSTPSSAASAAALCC